MLPARAVKKAMRALSPRVPERNWEIQFLGAGGRAALERHLLSPGRRGSTTSWTLVSCVSSWTLSPFAAPLEEGRGYSVAMLLTFAAWLEAHG